MANLPGFPVRWFCMLQRFDPGYNSLPTGKRNFIFPLAKCNILRNMFWIHKQRQNGLQVRAGPRPEPGSETVLSTGARQRLSALNPFRTIAGAAGESGKSGAGRAQNGFAGSPSLTFARLCSPFCGGRRCQTWVIQSCLAGREGTGNWQKCAALYQDMAGQLQAYTRIYKASHGYLKLFF